MQCSYDDRGNSVPTILLTMQKQLYSEGGLKAEGIFRINAENSQEEFVRDQLNRGVVPHGIDVHCLSGLMKAWFRELPSGVLDSLTPEQVMHCNTEDDCTNLVKLLPSTEATLLDWVINLMVDVVENEQFNKMNACNVAMVFAPNMTQEKEKLVQGHKNSEESVEEEESLRERAWKESKKMWVVAGPAIFIRFSTFGIIVVSQSFIGHIGSTKVAAYALVQTVLIRFANGVLVQREAAERIIMAASSEQEANSNK